MLNINIVNDFLNLLSFKLVEKDSTYYLEDLISKNIYPLTNGDDGYIVTISRDDTQYNFNLSHDGLIVKGSNSDYFSINKRGFSYQKKEHNSSYNCIFLSVNDDSLQIYQKDDFENKGISYSLGVKVYEDFDYLKMSETYEGCETIKNDIIIQKDNDNSIKQRIGRKYDSRGFLVFNDSSQELIDLPIKTCIVDSIVENYNVLDMLESIELILPGVCYYLQNSYPNFRDVFQRRNSKEDKVLKKAIN